MSLEARVEKLERSNLGVLDALSRIEFTLAEIKMELSQKSSKEDLLRVELGLKNEINTKASAIELAEVKGSLKEKPSTWTLLMAIMTSQIAYAGIIFAIMRFGMK